MPKDGVATSGTIHKMVHGKPFTTNTLCIGNQMRATHNVSKEHPERHPYVKQNNRAKLKARMKPPFHYTITKHVIYKEIYCSTITLH